MTLSGFSHSEICGSKVVCTSPQLIAASHVLHRLPVPRHPPRALTIFSSHIFSMLELIIAVSKRLYEFERKNCFVFALGIY